MPICKKKPKPKSVWNLKDGDRYFVLYHDGDMADYKWKGDTSLGACYRDYGNIFLTRDEAEKDVERRKVETLLLKYGGRRWFKDGVENWLIVLMEDRLTWFIYNESIQGVIYFDTEEQAEKAIEEIGKERIKQALFEVR